MDDPMANLPAPAFSNALEEGKALADAAADIGRDKFLFFKKGIYVDSNKEEVALGTEYLAQCTQWQYCWIKFNEGAAPTRMMYNAMLVKTGKLLMPRRDALDEQDKSKWGPDLNGNPKDPWIFQHYLPLLTDEDELVIFCTGNALGGKIAVGELGKIVGQRIMRTGVTSHPQIKLAKTTFPSKKWGRVERPEFQIIGWNDLTGGGTYTLVAPEQLKDEMNDSIPF